MKKFVAAALLFYALAAVAFDFVEKTSNGVVVVTCDKQSGDVVSIKALIDIPEGTEWPMRGACSIRS